MSFADIGRILLDANQQGADAFIRRYIEQFRNLQSAMGRPGIISSDISINTSYESDLDLFRFAAFSNDVFTFSFERSSRLTMVMLRETLNTLGVDLDKIEVDLGGRDFSGALDIHGHLKAMPAFSFTDSDEAKRFIESVSPLICEGNALPRPDRGLVTTNANIDQMRAADKPVTWDLIGVDHSTPMDRWQIKANNTDENLMPLRKGDGDREKEISLYDVSIPFISGVDFQDLSSILKDEHLHLANARKALRNVVKEANDGNISRDVVINEIIRPELDALERRFRSLRSSRLLKSGAAAVGSVGLTLTAYSTGGISAAVSSLAGAGGAGFLFNHWLESTQNKSSLSESPYYLFWRLRRLVPRA